MSDAEARRVDALKELINQRFDGLDRRIDRLADQVTETNGRLRKAENSISNFEPRMDAVEDAAAKPKGVSVDAIKWYLATAGGAVGSTLVLLKVVGKL